MRVAAERVRAGLWSAAFAVFAGFGAASSHAATIASVSPQGEVAQVRQVVVRFSEAVVPLGDLRQPDPVDLACTGTTPPGTGRWANDRTWLFDFREPLAPGARCTLKVRAGWKPQRGVLSGTTEFRFGTGGPAVVSMQPWDGATIEEDQHFILELNGPVVEASLAANAWCEVEGIGERLPVRLLTGAAREALLKARRLEKNAARIVVLACQRPLPNDVPVRLVWGKGIAAPLP